MIKTKDVLIPDIGEFDEVEVIEVLVKSGDTVSAEDPLLTMETVSYTHLTLPTNREV